MRGGGSPETIRALTRAVDGRIVPETYVNKGTPIVVETVSGAGDVTAGDKDAPLSLKISTLRPPLLAVPDFSGGSAQRLLHAQALRWTVDGPKTGQMPSARQLDL